MKKNITLLFSLTLYLVSCVPMVETPLSEKSKNKSKRFFETKDDPVPTLVSIAGAPKSSDKIELRVSLNQENPEVKSVLLYRDGSLIQSLNIIKSVTFIDLSLTANTSYQYKANAIDEAGDIIASSTQILLSTDREEEVEEEEVPVSADTTAPTAPSGIEASSIGLNSFTINWQHSTDNKDVKNYFVYLNNTLYKDLLYPVNVLVIDNLNSATSFEVKIRAMDSSGNYSLFSNTVQVQTLTPPPLVTDPFLLAKEVMRNNCFQCHNGSTAKKFNFETEKEYIDSGLIIPGDQFAQSKLLTRTYETTPVGARNMPKQRPAWGSADYQKIFNWIKNIKANDPVSENPTTEFSRFQTINISTRNYVFNTFKTIFGESLTESYKKNIWDQADSFGGPCDMAKRGYRSLDPSNPTKKELVDEYVDCDYRTTGASVKGSDTTVRSGWIINTCELAVNDSTSMDFFLSKVHSGGAATTPNATTLSKAFTEFYPGETIPSGYLSSLQAMASSPTDWKTITLSICLSSSWQIP